MNFQDNSKSSVEAITEQTTLPKTEPPLTNPCEMLQLTEPPFINPKIMDIEEEPTKKQPRYYSCDQKRFSTGFLNRISQWGFLHVLHTGIFNSDFNIISHQGFPKG